MSAAALVTYRPMPARATAKRNPLAQNPKTLTFEKLEEMRLRRLGMPTRFSRHFKEILEARYRHETPTYASEYLDLAKSLEIKKVPTKPKPSRAMTAGAASKSNNTLAPFSTLEKPTCGCFFSRKTENRKRNFGIPPSDLVKWRSFVA